MNLLTPHNTLNNVNNIIPVQNTTVKPNLSPILLANILNEANANEYISLTHYTVD